MIRSSALNIAEHCQLAPILAKRFPSKSEATDRGSFVDDQTTAFLQHGTAPTDPDAKAIVEWICATFDPTSWELRSQQKVALVSEGKLLTEGTPDLVAVDGRRVVVVDFKKRHQRDAGRLHEPDDNLQVHSYALASASHYRTCLLLFGDGRVEALWSIDYTPENTGPILERIKAIAAAETENTLGVSGPHCITCWSRLQCPHWALRAHKGITEPTRPSRENAADLMLETVAMEETAERNRKTLKAMVDMDGPFRVGDREFRRCMTAGKVTIDGSALEAAGLYERFSKVGRDYPVYRLCRPSGKETE